MNKYVVSATFAAIVIVAMTGTRPEKWKSDYLGMSRDEVIGKLGVPDQSGFEEFFWLTSFEILGFELFGSYMRLGISPGQNPESNPVVLHQSYGYTFAGSNLISMRE